MHNTIHCSIHMHTFVIFEPNATLRQQIIQEQLTIHQLSSFNCVTLLSDAPSIGIAETRQFIKSLSLAPHSGDYTAGVIPNTHLLTPDAQQSLLKTLEEPPLHAYIFLGAEHILQLLPTIVSRCIPIVHQGIVTQRNDEECSTIQSLLTSLYSASPGERIRRIQSIGKTKDEIDHWIDIALYVLHTQLSNHEHKIGDPSIVRSLIHHLIRTKKYLTYNVQPLFLIEHAFLMAIPYPFFQKPLG